MTLLLAGILAAFILWLAIASDAARRPSPARITRTPWLHARLHRPFPSWWLRAALCVHSREGSWQANTGNGFTGGMQFITSTWLANGGGVYAPAAYLASPHEQLHIAWNLYRRAGWAPWPNTARMCGLR